MDDIAEKIRVRIMQEAYDLADRNDSEGYNSVKVMCSDVLALLPRREWVGLTEEERDHFEGLHLYAGRNQVEAWIEGVPAFIDAIEAKLREKNTYTSPPQRKPLPPQSPCEMTQAEGKMFKLGWLECEAAHGIKGE